jgi:hypothetical protein
MRQTALLFGVLLLAACGPTNQQKTVNLQQQRLYASLGDAARAGAVTITDQPDGAEIVFPDTAIPFTPDARISMIQALIDPSLLRIGIAAPAGLPPYEAHRRVQDWSAYFAQMQVGDAEIGPTPQAVPSAMAVKLQVICPRRQDRAGYDDGTRRPGCF